MFGRKKMYKKGLADAMQAYEAFGRKQEAALSHMREEVLKGNQKLETALFDLGEDLDGIYDYLTSKEKATLYHLSTPIDIKELENEEKRLLLAILYQLSFDEGNSVTDSQQGYIRSIQKYLEITNPQTEADLSTVGDIDSLETQKAFLQVVLEFLYLQDSDELSEEQEDFLGYFSVNRKQAVLIEERVSRLFNAVGDKGIAEKYGYVPEEDALEENCVEISDANDQFSLNENPDFSSALYHFMKTSRKEYAQIFETKNYLVSYFRGHDTVVRLDKNTGAQSDFYYHHGDFPSPSVPENGDVWYNVLEDTIFFGSGGLMAFDVNKFEKPSRLFQKKPNQPLNSWSISGKWFAYQHSLDHCVMLFDIENKFEVSVCYGDLPLYSDRCALAGDKVIFLGREMRNCRYYKNAFFSYDIAQKKLKKLFDYNGSLYSGDFIMTYSDSLILYKGDYTQQCAHLYCTSLTDSSAPWTLIGDYPKYQTCDNQYYEDGILHTSPQNPDEIYFIDFKNIQTVKVASSEDGKQYYGRVTFAKIGRLIYYLEGHSLYRASIDDPMKPVLVFTEPD